MIYPRKFYIDKINGALSRLPIVVLIGASQVGKTTIMQNLDLKGGKLFLNGQDPEIAEIFEKFSVLENYLEINLNKEIKGHLLIDEFQFIPGISTMLKLLVDKHRDLKILCTGSSSLDILQHVEESLAGRVRVIEIFSLSFEEYLMFSDRNLHQLFLKYNSDTQDAVFDNGINLLFNEYLLFGGFPRVSLTNSANDKIELLNDIYRTYLLRDVRSYIRNEDSVGFNKLLKILASQIGNLVNINELSNTSGLGYKKTEEYLYLLEQMYIIKLLDPYFTNKRKVVTKMRKVYFTDTGLRNLIYGSFNDLDIRVDSGSIYENNVFLEMKRIIGQTGTINFYRTQDGTEVDFIVNTWHELISVEVKIKAMKEPVFMRNIISFNNIEKVSSSFIINKSLNSHSRGLHFIQAYLTSKIFSTKSD